MLLVLLPIEPTIKYNYWHKNKSPNFYIVKIMQNQIRQTPYWWEDVNYPDLNERLPNTTELLVVGAGYTGLMAAIETAKAGMSVTILEKGEVNEGCSSRNGGQISTGLKPSIEKLGRCEGMDLAERCHADARDALAFTEDKISSLNMPTDYVKNGRFCAAHTPKQYRMLVALAEASQQAGSNDLSIVEPHNQHTELGSDLYHGGLVNHAFSSVQPAKYHNALINEALSLGVTIIPNCEAQSHHRHDQQFEVLTARGKVIAKRLLITTNGYSGSFSKWIHKRIIPIGTYMLATEELSANLQQTLIPNSRHVVDTKKIVVYFRNSPDGKRLIFGGRAALAEKEASRCLPDLRNMMLQIFPQLSNTSITHNWGGFVGFTFDNMPHIGCHEGVYYAMGYCGSGVALATYFGHKVGLQILGKQEGITAINELSFQTRPLYSGTPWFLAPSISYYKLVDKFFS